MPENIFAEFFETDQPMVDPLDAPVEPENIFSEYFEPEPPPEPEPEVGRFGTAVGSFAEGLVSVGTSYPKSFALKFAGVDVDVLDDMERIDKGMEPQATDPFPSGSFAPQDIMADAVRKESFDKVTRYKEADAAGRESMRVEIDSKVKAAIESRMYQAGVSVDEMVKEALPTDPEYQQEWLAGKIPQGFGSVVGFIGATYLTRRAAFGKADTMTRGMNIVGSLAGAGTAGSAVNYAGEFERALNEGASLADAFRTTDYSGYIGALEAVPIFTFLDRVDKVSGGLIKKTLVHMMLQGTEEAIQEGLTEIFNNIGAAAKYDPERGTFEGLGEATGTGFTIGAITEALGTLLPGRRARMRGDQGAGEPSPLDAIDQAEEQVTREEGGIDRRVIEDRQAEARAQVEEEGGDRLSQERAAAEVASEYASQVHESNQNRSAFFNRERALQEQREAEETQRQEAQAAEEQRVAETEKAFQQREQQQAAQKEEERKAAQYDVALQEGAKAEQIEPYIAEGPARGPALGEALKAAQVKAEPAPVAEKPVEPVVVEKPAEPTPVVVEPPTNAEVNAEVKAAGEEAATSPINALPEPTPAQKSAGNYKKGHLSIQGLDIAVENPPGSKRMGREIKETYGYIKRTEGRDEDQVDVFIGKTPDSDKVFVIDQVNEDGSFDEHKVMLGYKNQFDAVRAYKSNYEKGWKVGPVTEMTVDGLKTWLAKGKRTQPVSGKVPVLSGIEEAQQLEDRYIQRGGKRKGKIRYRVADIEPLSVGQPRLGEKPTGKPMQASEAGKVISTVRDVFDAISPTIFRTAADAPSSLYAAMVRNGTTAAKGMFIPKTGEVFIFIDAHKDAADLVSTLMHEGVAHKGLRAFSHEVAGVSMDQLMDEVYAGANKLQLRRIAKSYNLNLSKKEDQREAADEYVAYLAQNMPKSKPLQKVVDWVRGMLRNLGVVRKWSDKDIHALLRNVRTKISETKADVITAKAKKQQPAVKKPVKKPAEKPVKEQVKALMRLSDEEAAVLKKQKSDSPLAVISKQASTMEAALQDKTPVAKLKNKLSNWNDKKIRPLLQLVPRRNLPDFIAGDTMPSVKKYIRQANRMDGRRNELMEIPAEIAKRWNRFVSKNRDQARVLGEMMHASTLAGVDPSEKYKPLKDPKRMTADDKKVDARRRSNHKRLKGFWDKMAPDGQKLYTEVRDAYVERRKMVETALNKRIEESDASEKAKKNLLDTLKLKFESGRTTGPYFPLQRFGDYWAVAKDKDTGEVMSFSKFEDRSDRTEWVKTWRDEGMDVTPGEMSKTMAGAEMVGSIDPKFMKNVTSLLGEYAGPEIKSTADEIWQMYLQSLPEMSMRKSFMHRKGRLGFTTDALKSFSHTMFHGAHQLARLENVYQMEDSLRSMEKEAKAAVALDDKDSQWAMPVFDEMKLRHNFAMAPTGAKWATGATTFGFAWYLGATPAAAFVNLTQTAIVAYPVLAAKFNVIGATNELLKASGQVAGARGKYGDKLRGDERKAWDEAYRIGLFDKTQAHDLAGVSEDGMDYSETTKRAMEVASWMFHTAEQFNRQVTFIAAYRLAKKKGQSHDASVTTAEDVVWDSHFDYGINNRPRVMQGNLARVLLLFRQYSANMTYRITRDFNDGFLRKVKSPEVRKESRQRFAGMMTMTAMLAGTTGLPAYSVIVGILEALLEDEDEPLDITASTRHWIAETTGSAKVAEAVMKGPFDAFNPFGASISARVSLSQLWFRDTPESLEGSRKWLHYLGEAAGPVFGIGENIAQGIANLGDVPTMRGLERFVPKAIADTMKAYRYSKEGATTFRGDVLLDKDDFSFLELVGQTAGFSPAQLAQRYEQNRAIKDAEFKILKRRGKLLDKFFLGARNNDKKLVSETTEEIKRFNSKVPPNKRIGWEAIQRSAKSRARYSARAVGGITVNKDLMYLHKKYDFITQGTDK